MGSFQRHRAFDAKRTPRGVPVECGPAGGSAPASYRGASGTGQARAHTGHSNAVCRACVSAIREGTRHRVAMDRVTGAWGAVHSFKCCPNGGAGGGGGGMKQRILGYRTAPVSQATGHGSRMFRCTAAPFMFISLSFNVTNSAYFPPAAPVRGMHSPHCSCTGTLLYSRIPGARGPGGGGGANTSNASVGRGGGGVALEPSPKERVGLQPPSHCPPNAVGCLLTAVGPPPPTLDHGWKWEAGVH